MMLEPSSIESFSRDMSQKVTPWPPSQKKPILPPGPFTEFSLEQQRHYLSIWLTGYASPQTRT